MSDDGVFTICDRCQAMIDPAAPDTVLAHEQDELVTGEGTEFIEGQGVLFHARCYPGDSRRLKRARPA